MDAQLILYYGHQTVMQTLDSVPQSEWEIGGVCGVWSIKDIVGHLAAFEHLLTDVFSMFLHGGPTPYMDEWGQKGPAVFNDDQADLRKDKPVGEVLNEYKDAYARNMELAAKISTEIWAKKGTMPWYGEEYSLDDFIVFTFYGHKREHTAQIDVFRDSPKS